MYIFAADGIRFPMYEWPTLPWSEVQGTRLVTRRGLRYLAIYAQNAEARIGHMRRGARMARWNVRNGLGLIAIPEQQAPVSLEALQAEVVTRQRATPVELAAAPTPNGGSSTILPVSVDGAGSAADRSLRLVGGLHGLTLLLSAAGGHQSSTHRMLAVALGGALVLGASLATAAPVVGVVLIVAAEAALVMLDLSAGHNVAVATRVLYLFFPACVLIAAAQTSPRRQT